MDGVATLGPGVNGAVLQSVVELVVHAPDIAGIGVADEVGDGDGVGDALGVDVALGDADGHALDVGCALEDGDVAGDGDAPGVFDGVWVGVAVGITVAVAAGLGVAVCDGNGVSGVPDEDEHPTAPAAMAHKQTELRKKERRSMYMSDNSARKRGRRRPLRP